MFPVLESTRRRWCRQWFVALCLAPTACLLVCAARLHSAGHRRAVEEQLERGLGLTVTVGAATHPRPGVTRLTNVAWADPETGATLGRADRLDCLRTGGGWDLQAAEVTLDAAQGTLLADTAQRALRRGRRDEAVKLQWRANRLHWIRGDHEFACCQAAGTWESSAAGATGKVQFVRADQSSGDAAQVRVMRDRTTSPPVTRWDLNCGSTPLPGWLLLVGTDNPLRLGDEAEFAGYLWASQASTGWEGQLTGRFHDVDLATLWGEETPRLSGPAELSVNLLRVQGGRIHRFDGAVSAGPGAIQFELVQSLAQELSLPVSRQAADHASGTIAYRELNGAILLDEQGLTLRGGCCGRADSGILVHLERGPLLGDTKRPVAVAALLRGLSPALDSWSTTPTVPWLAQHLAPTVLSSAPGPNEAPSGPPGRTELGRPELGRQPATGATRTR